MLKPNPVSIDGNLFLNNISSSILGSMEDKDIIFQSTNPNPMRRGRGMLIKAFLNKYFKLISDINSEGYRPTHSYILWDRKKDGKYHKTVILDELGESSTYKSDRKYYTEEDLKQEGLTKELEIKIKAAICRNTEFLEARKFIQKNFGNYGIHSFSLPGWEADDIDFIWGKETTSREGIHIHCSSDSDWQYHLTKDDILFQPLYKGGYLVKTVKTVREKMKIPEGMNLMDWAQINFSALGSHNNLLRTIKPEIKKFTKKYREKLFSEGPKDIISDTLRYEAQKRTFEIESFEGLDLVKSLYKKMISDCGHSSGNEEFSNLLNSVGVQEKDKFSLINRYKAYKSLLLKSTLDIIDESI